MLGGLTSPSLGSWRAPGLCRSLLFHKTSAQLGASFPALTPCWADPGSLQGWGLIKLDTRGSQAH